ncbi:hypothetical protein [Saccharopolyspora griseoalba]|uniref:Uncharacterized protein n=1 Tax=Saccharopolyspora griseoalba TaxID=1431848 RepID=A0ABW2LR65_9PSEU
MSKRTDNGSDAAFRNPVEGGRICPSPSELIALRGPWGARRPARRLGTTGVISADVGTRH